MDARLTKTSGRRNPAASARRYPSRASRTRPARKLTSARYFIARPLPGSSCNARPNACCASATSASPIDGDLLMFTRAVDPKDRVEVWANIEEGIDRIDTHPHAAQQAFGARCSLDPGNGLATKYLADVSFRAGRLREARDGYRRAIAAGFRHPDVFVNLAAIAEREGRLDEARAALTEAVRSRAATPTRGTVSACSRCAAAISTPRDAHSPAPSPRRPIAQSRTTTWPSSNGGPATRRRRRRCSRTRSRAIQRIRKRTTSSAPDICRDSNRTGARRLSRSARGAARLCRSAIRRGACRARPRPDRRGEARLRTVHSCGSARIRAAGRRRA